MREPDGLNHLRDYLSFFLSFFRLFFFFLVRFAMFCCFVVRLVVLLKENIYQRGESGLSSRRLQKFSFFLSFLLYFVIALEVVKQLRRGAADPTRPSVPEVLSQPDMQTYVCVCRMIGTIMRRLESRSRPSWQ